MNPLLLTVIDGLRSDALTAACTPCLDRLMAEGARTMNARTVIPSITLPAHFSLFTSLKPISHGVMANTALPDPSAMSQSLFSQVKAAGGATSAFYSWEHLRNLALPGALDHALYRKVKTAEDLDCLSRAAADHISAARPDFTFLYLEWPDIFGHCFGWMSGEYIAAVEEADRALNTVLDPVLEADDGVTVMVLSDHGGKGTHHTGPDMETLTVPFIVRGPGIPPDSVIAEPVTLIDAAPTIAALMGIRPHFSWEGRCLFHALPPGQTTPAFAVR